MAPEDHDESPSPDERVPCTDDMCTGILGLDGRCGTCGRVILASPREAVATAVVRAARDASDEGGDVEVVPPGAEPPVPDAPATDAADAPPSSDERVPCADDMCTGIVGADGRCGTCGRAA